MQITTDTIEVLNDLLAIHNDRIRGYENAIEETTLEDSSLKALFNGMILESKAIRLQLAGEVETRGGEFETGTTGAGKLYRAWTDIAHVFTGHDRYTILSSCEHNEDATQKAYREALGSEDLSGRLRTLLMAQQQELKLSHDQIKSMRDSAVKSPA